METTLVLIAIKGNYTKIVFGPAIPKLIAWKKAELIKSGNWQGWEFQLRNYQAYKVIPILTKKTKLLTYEEKKLLIK